MRQRKGTQFNCFSPPVMVATILIECGLVLYAVWRYKLTQTVRLAVMILIALATFQLAEYFVCTGGGHAEQWSRLGFVAITTLPPLGLHLLHRLANKTDRRVVYGAYATMLGFIGFFLFTKSAFVGQECTGNYVIFQIGYELGGYYAAYYYGWLLTAIGLGILWANQLKREGSQAIRRLQAVRGLIVGYLVFLVPTALTNSVNPKTTDGIPSIMCGFAVIFALIVALYILPRVAKTKR
jgi:hypothetical protein